MTFLSNPLARLRAFDFAVLDRVYTPVAHWLHDEFGWRSHQVSRACLIGNAIALAAEQPSDFVSPGVAWPMFAAFAALHLAFVQPSPIGRINIRRYADQTFRLLIWASSPPFLASAAQIAWVVFFLSLYYFEAVSDRPRQPRRSFEALPQGGAA